MPRTLTALCLVVLVAGCSRSQPEAAAPVASVPTPNESSTIAASTEEATVAAAPETSDPSESAWCVSARTVHDASDSIDAVDPADPAAVEAAVTDMLDAAESAAPLAPPEIAADVQVSLDTLRALDAALAAVDYDLLRADLSALADPDGEDSAAVDRVDAYNADVCGLEAAIDDRGGADFDPAAGTIREQTIALLVERGFTADEAACLFDHIDFGDPEFAQDEAALLALVETCRIDLDRLTELG